MAWALLLFPVLVSVSCTNKNEQGVDLLNNSFVEAQAEIRAVVQSIYTDAETANIEGLQSIHLVHDKFTKFGPRSFYRQDVASTNELEAAHFGSIENFKADVKDLKVDVFGEIAIATYYPHTSFEVKGEKKGGISRQTFVFLKTQDGWKLVHEHGTPAEPQWKL